MQSLLLIVTSGSTIHLPVDADEPMCGYNVPLENDDKPEERVRILCDELALEPTALNCVGALRLYGLPKPHRARQLVRWETFITCQPTQSIQLFHAHVPPAIVDTHALRESVPYEKLPSHTKHWLPYVLLGSGVLAHIIQNGDGTHHSCFLQFTKRAQLSVHDAVISVA